MQQATLSIHGDKASIPSGDIAPPIHVSTTFFADNKEGYHYARNDQPTRHRAELLIGKLESGYAVLYSSGMATVWAVLNHCRPNRVAIDKGYHVTHKALASWFKGRDGSVISFQSEFQQGDLVWLETPKNPTSELYDIEAFAKRTKAAGAVLLVDSTFASPALQNPLRMGADISMHSCTKYLSGHDDTLCGVLVVADKTVCDDLMTERTILGSLPGNMECYLLLRSIRTLKLRVLQQSNTACKLAEFFQKHPKVEKVWHPSLNTNNDYELCKKQMVGAPAVLSVEFRTMEITMAVLNKVKLFVPATSIGGCLSLVDWRHGRDPTQPERLLRISTGLENATDLIADLTQALSG